MKKWMPPNGAPAGCCIVICAGCGGRWLIGAAAKPDGEYVCRRCHDPRIINRRKGRMEHAEGNEGVPLH